MFYINLTQLLLFRIDYVRSFCYTLQQYYLRGGIFNMDESDSDSEANQFNSIEFLFIYRKAWTMYSEHRPCLLLLLSECDM